MDRLSDGAQIKISMDHVIGDAHFSILCSFDDAPIDQAAHIFMDALHIPSKRACETANAVRPNLLQVLDQFPSLGAEP